MPICKSTVSAFVRSRASAPFSASKTLVPFLYQTPTIQQWRPAAHTQPRRTLATSPDRDDRTPTIVEDDVLPPSLEEVEAARAASANTTMTRSERAAFGKLYKEFNKEARDQKLREDDSDRIADEWYEEDDDNQKLDENLDELFEAVMAGLPPQKEAPKQPEPQPTRRKITTEEKRGQKRAQKQDARQKEIKERQRLNELLDAARTDRELWNTLEREVLDKIRALDLDGLNKDSNKQAAAPSPPGSVQDTRVLFNNFPHYMVDAAFTLRRNFCTSMLPFSIIPTLKSMGRSTYALGASTPLYNLLIRATWKQYGSLDAINELLTDMNNAGLEYNDRTVAIFNNIQHEYRLARTRKLGMPLCNVFGAEAVKDKFDEFLALAFPGQEQGEGDRDDHKMPPRGAVHREVEPLIPFGRPALRHAASENDDIPLVM